MPDPYSSLGDRLEKLLQVKQFPPSAGFAARAVVSDPVVYEQAAADPAAWWATQARERLHWDTPFSSVLDDSNPPFFTWFADGTINVSYNCLDRHVLAGRGDRVAFHWRGEEGEERDLTYAELLDDVQRLANALKAQGVRKGDVVGIYLPMIPEVVVAMLACARIGAPHTVVFGGFAPTAVRERLEVSRAKALIIPDGARRKGKFIPVKHQVDEVISDLPDLETVVVVRSTGTECVMRPGRDVWFDDLIASADPVCPAEPMEAEHPLFLLYSSGSTAKPKGILHTTGGYLTGVTTTTAMVFDLDADRDVFWCTADVGWITGHSFVHRVRPAGQRLHVGDVRGRPGLPGQGHLVGDHRAVRRDDLLHRADRHPGLHEVGRGIPGQARPVVAAPARDGRRADQPQGMAVVPHGHRRRALPDRGHMVADGDRSHHDHDAAWPPRGEAGIGRPPAARRVGRPGGRIGCRGREGQRPPRADPAVAGHAPQPVQRPRPVRADLLRPVRPAHLFRRRRRQARPGRLLLDHRAEIESALVSHPAVAEAAVIAAADDLTGQSVVAYVTLSSAASAEPELETKLREHVGRQIGKLARPTRIIWADDLPKTRSGKIMRRLLRDIAENREPGDVTTLRDASVLTQLKQNAGGQRRQGLSVPGAAAR